MNAPDAYPTVVSSATPQRHNAPVLGALTALNGDVVEGWAYDPGNPALRLIVEIYVDGVYVGVTRADLEQPHDAPGDGFHGFAFQIRSDWLDKARSISARLANQGPWLSGSITLP